MFFDLLLINKEKNAYFKKELMVKGLTCSLHWEVYLGFVVYHFLINNMIDCEPW